MNAAWTWVIAGGFAETAWAVCLKLSDGFSEPLYVVPMLLFLALSMLLLNRGFRAGLPTGPCYAVWVGIGAVGSALAGSLMGDSMGIASWLCIALIVGGVAGLNLLSEGDGGRARLTCPGRTCRAGLWSGRRARRTRPWARGS